MGRSLFHDIYFHILATITDEVVRASSPDRAVASPYEGIRKGSRVMMNIPKPKPVVRCTKLAPVARSIIYGIFSNIRANLQHYGIFLVINFIYLR